MRCAQDRVRAVGVASEQRASHGGEVAQTILDVAGEKDADAIVVGKRGSGQLAGALLGSVSQKLVSLAPRVVMVVP